MQFKLGNPRKSPAASSPKPRFNPERRAFLRRAAAFASLAGCALPPIIGGALELREAKDGTGFPGPSSRHPGALSNAMENLKFLRVNSHMLTSAEADAAKGLHEEWNALSGFVDSSPLPSQSSPEDLQKLVFPVYQGASRGSGILITPRHILTAEHAVDGIGVSVPTTEFGCGSVKNAGKCISPTRIASSRRMDLALLTLPPGAFPMDASVPLAKLYPGLPASGSRICAFGYPGATLGTYGHPLSLVRMDCIAKLYHPKTATIIISRVGEQLLSGEKTPYRDYSVEGFTDPGGMSGGPVVSGDGRILGIVANTNNKRFRGRRSRTMLFASGTAAIHALIMHCLNGIASRITACAQEVRERLLDSAYS